MGRYADMLFAGGAVSATPVEAPTARSYSDLLLGGQSQTQAAAPPAAPAGAEPDAPTWLGRRAQDIRGRQDPRYAGLPNLNEALADAGLSDPLANVGPAMLAGANDAALGDIAKKALGNRFIGRETDANGFEIIRFKGKGGAETAAYLNKPGLDLYDVERFAAGTAPYAAVSAGLAAATGGASIPAQMLVQGLGAGVTSVGGDIASMLMGSEQGLDLGKAAFTAGAAAAGPPVAAGLGDLWRRFVTVPGLYNKTTGRLTDKGARAARAAGVNPDDIEGEIAKVFSDTYAKTGRATEAAIAAETHEFGIPSTVGQRTKNPQKLTEEEAIRRGNYGPKAQSIIKGIDEREKQAVDYAVRSRLPAAIREDVLGTEGGATMNPRGMTDMPGIEHAQDLGSSIRSGLSSARDVARAQEEAAWEQVKDLLPKQQSFELLPDALAGQLGGLRVTAQMEKASSMAKALDDYVAGKAFDEPVAGVLKQAPVKTVDDMRRQLLAMYKGAKDPTDAKAAQAIYHGFNDWIEDAARQNLLMGRPEDAAAMVTARDIGKTMRSLFSPTIKGHKTPAAKIISDVLDNGDTPEAVITSLFGGSGPQAMTKTGAVEALKAIRAALYKYGDRRVANDTWTDIGIAYWQRLVQNKRGDTFTPTMLLGNIKTALNNQKSLIDTLYGPKGLSQMRLLATALERIVYKPTNPSGTGYAVQQFAKQFAGKIFGGFGMKSLLARTVLERSGLVDSYGTALAKKAVEETTRARPPRFVAPLTTAVGAEFGRQSD